MPKRQLSLPDEVYEGIKRFLPEAKATEEYVEGCVQCGLALEKELEECREQIRVAERIKATFFPDRP